MLTSVLTNRGWPRWLAAILFFTFFVVGDAAALSFLPTAREWIAWPQYCRARYVVSAAGRDSKYAGRVPRAEVNRWKQQLGGAWYGLHHYCAGLASLNKAKLTRIRAERERDYQYVLRQARYTLERTPQENPMYAKIAVTMAEASAGLGHLDEAFEYLDRARALHPTETAAYAVAALIYRDGGKLEKAKEILIQGNEAVEGKSSELHYILGLILLELKEFETAREHAKQAYELGYPLPGLKKKLKAAGYWTD